jgi:hypothetical protein
MKEKIAFIDLDQTVADTKLLEGDRKVPDGWIEVFAGPRRYATIVRPSAAPFLRQLRERDYSVQLLTSGRATFQALVLETHNLRQYFEEIHGIDANLSGVSAPWVLVDDLDGRCNGTVDKFAQLGIWQHNLTPEQWSKTVQRHLVTCGAFWRGKEIEPLTALLDQIDDKFTRLMDDERISHA